MMGKFRRNSSYSKRLRAQTEEPIETTGIYRCSECNARFETVSDADQHTVRDHYGLVMTINGSHTSLTESQRLTLALIRAKKVVNVLRCVDCNEEFGTALDVKQHLDVCGMSKDIKYWKTRDSFDRFNEYLAEELLSRLDFEHCFAYECVSKKWREVVFNRQYSLRLSGYGGMDSKRAVDCMARKMSRLRDVLIYNQAVYYPHILNTIRFRCRHLRSIRIENFILDDLVKALRLLLKRCGPNLKRLTLLNVDDKPVHALLKLTPNLIEAEINGLDDIVDDIGSEILLPKLKKISATINYSTELLTLQLFSDVYSRQIENINLDVFKIDDNIKISMFEELSRFVYLDELWLAFNAIRDWTPIISADNLNTIAMNCKKLSRLSLIGIQCLPVVDSDLKFSNLKRLTLTLDKFDARCLSMCPNLIDLNVTAGDYSFDGIHTIVPHLKSFKLSYSRKKKLYFVSLFRISNIKTLESLRLDGRQTTIDDNELIYFVRKLLAVDKLKILEIQCIVNVGIIDKLRAIVICDPKRNIVFGDSLGYEYENDKILMLLSRVNHSVLIKYVVI